MLSTMLERQDQMQKELIQEEMAKQREWEERKMEKERNFQQEQTNLIMQTFSQSILSLRPQMPVLSHNYTPLKLIPVSLIDIYLFILIYIFSFKEKINFLRF